jgi:organic radical activating enzyme
VKDDNDLQREQGIYKEYSKVEHGKAWCPIPFNAISFHPTGVLTRCMMSDVPMGEDFDSEEMQKLRTDMLNGIWDKEGCINCLKKEEQGNISQRQKWLQRNPQDFKNTDGYINPKVTGNPVNHMFINYSNICNFKCRMCSPGYSNSLIPEHKHLNTLGLGRKVKPEIIKNRNFINTYLKENPEKLDSLSSIWITGGEPFMDDNCFELMDILNEYDKSFDMDVVITTNGSKVDLNKLQKFENLKWFELDLSIDAPSKMFEYMRSDGLWKWEQMRSLIDDLMHFKKQNDSWFNMCYNSSIQAYNFDTVVEFNELCKEAGALNNTRMLIFPEHLRLNVLPLDIRMQEYEKIKDYKVVNDPRFQRTFDDVLKNLQAPQARKEMVDKFKIFTKAQDKYRNKTMLDYHKTLGNFIYNE